MFLFLHIVIINTYLSWSELWKRLICLTWQAEWNSLYLFSFEVVRQGQLTNDTRTLQSETVRFDIRKHTMYTYYFEYILCLR